MFSAMITAKEFHFLKYKEFFSGWIFFFLFYFIFFGLELKNVGFSLRKYKKIFNLRVRKFLFRKYKELFSGWNFLHFLGLGLKKVPGNPEVYY